MSAEGFAGVCASDKKADVETFVGRLIYSLGLRISSYPGCQQCASDFAGKVRAVNCVVESTRPIYDGMVAKIREDAAAPGSWVTDPKASAGATESSPQVPSSRPTAPSAMPKAPTPKGAVPPVKTGQSVNSCERDPYDDSFEKEAESDQDR